MDITYVYHTDYSPKVAHGKQIIHTCNELAERGHNLTLVSSGDIHEFAQENNTVLNFEVVHQPVHLPGIRPDQISYFLTAIFVAKKSDVLYTRDIRFLKFLSLFPPFRRLLPPILYEAHKVYHQLEPMSAKDEYEYISLAKAVITNSEGVRTDLEGIGVTVDKVAPNAANIDLVPSETKEELRRELDMDLSGITVVYAGSFDTQKNDLELVIQGVARVSKMEDVNLLMIGGSNSIIDDLRQVAQDAGLKDDMITFTGRIPHGEVFKYLKASDIGIIPLIPTNTEFDRYTSPLKLFEYLVCGLYVLAADLYAIEQAAGDIDAVSTYESESVESFANSLQSLITSYQIVTGESTEIDSEKFSYANRVDDVENVLRNVIDG